MEGMRSISCKSQPLAHSLPFMLTLLKFKDANNVSLTNISLHICRSDKVQNNACYMSDIANMKRNGFWKWAFPTAKKMEIDRDMITT